MLGRESLKVPLLGMYGQADDVDDVEMKVLKDEMGGRCGFRKLVRVVSTCSSLSQR